MKHNQRFLLLICLLIVALAISACDSSTSDTADSTDAENSAPMTDTSSNTNGNGDTDTPDPATTSPTSTPATTNDLPAIELLEGPADTCRVEESYEQVVGYNSNFYQTTTVNAVVTRLVDANGNELAASTSFAENSDGEGGWGWYPIAYRVPDNSALTVEIYVYEGDAESSDITSISTLTYNCTTGETLQTTFETYE